MNEKTVRSLKPSPGYAAIAMALLVTAAMIILLNDLAGGKFLEVSNIRIIVNHSIYPAFIAWSLCFAFASNHIDLSVGSILVLAAFLATLLGNRLGYPGLVFGGLVTGTLLVFINYYLFVVTKIPSWIAGISMAMVYEAAAMALSKSDYTNKLINTELSHAYRSFAQMPANLVILAFGLLVAYILYNRTTIGFNIRAIGSNLAVSKALGIKASRTLLTVGLTSGLFLGIGAFMEVSYVAQLTVKTGLTSLGLMFQPIAIVLLAQILQKKLNIILAVPLCSIVIFAAFNWLTILGVPSGTIQDLVLGAFVIVFGMIGQKNEKGVVK